MAVSSGKRLSLDTNLLLDLAEGKDFAEEFLESFQARGYELLVTPTVAGELNALSILGGKPQRTFAHKALYRLRHWNCQPFALSDTKLAIADRFAYRLSELRLIPEEEQNDGRILGETSLAGIPLLVTSDRRLLDLEEEELLLAFHGADLSPVNAAHPKRLLKALQ
jgi:hypothetical protein